MFQSAGCQYSQFNRASLNRVNNTDKGTVAPLRGEARVQGVVRCADWLAMDRPRGKGNHAQASKHMPCRLMVETGSLSCSHKPASRCCSKTKFPFGCRICNKYIWSFFKESLNRLVRPRTVRQTNRMSVHVAAHGETV